MTTTRMPTAGPTRRPVVRALMALTLAGSFLGLQSPTGTAAAAPREGTDYVQLEHPVPASAREVVEVFWYNCSHSYQLQTPLQEWAARQNPPVTIVRIPAAWPDHPDMVAYARLYYALDRLGLADRLAMAVFHAVRDERRDLTQPDELAQWASEQPDLDPQRLLDAWNSPEVAQEVQRAPALRERYEVHEEPSVVVGGTYRTSPFLATGGVRGTVPVVDYLLQHSAATRHRR